MKIIYCLVLIFMISMHTQAQTTQNVCDVHIKIGSVQTEELHFSFAAGDRILITLSEQNQKEITEIEVDEYPSQKKFSTRKFTSLQNKEISITNNAIYVFRIKNGAVSRRDVHLKIERTPLSEKTQNFNTAVTWITVNDTTWKTTARDGIIRYDTSHIPQKNRIVIQEKNVEELLLDKNVRIHSKTNLKESKSTLAFQIPDDEITSTTEKKLVSWAYWVGVNESGNKAWEQNSKIITKIVKGGASMLLSPLGALAVGVVADLSVPTMGEDVEYWLTDQENIILFEKGKRFKSIDHGKGVAAYQKFGRDTGRQLHIALKNDNIVQAIDVNVKVIGIYLVKTWGDVTSTETKITPVRGRIHEKKPIVKQIRKPVLADNNH